MGHAISQMVTSDCTTQWPKQYFIFRMNSALTFVPKPECNEKPVNEERVRTWNGMRD